jgi:hypothetical protein
VRHLNARLPQPDFGVQKSYADSNVPLAPGPVEAIAAFVRDHQR